MNSLTARWGDRTSVARSATQFASRKRAESLAPVRRTTIERLAVWAGRIEKPNTRGGVST